jgi:HEAT repeat protein
MRHFFLLSCILGQLAAAPALHKYTVTRAGEAYGITVSVMAPESFTTGAIEVAIRDPQGELVHKTLHPQDLDLYATVRPRRAGEIVVRLENAPDAAKVKVEFSPLSINDVKRIAAQPNSDWSAAQEIEVGATVYGSNDERPYVPVSPEKSYAALVSSFQWFRFTAKKPQLIYFVLETPERDVPPDLEIFELKDGSLTPYSEGASAYTPEATQNFPGLSPFRTRTVHAGNTYYLRVAANHPFYRLRTDAYLIKDPQSAVRAGMDFLVNLGYAWHANTPRRGAVALRSALAHPEPQSCIACHPTQFTTRGYLTAVKNGYPDSRPFPLDFLLTRLENNPRPLYGQADTNWARVIYSARTVSSRVPALLDLAARPNPGIEKGYANYLSLTGGSHDEPDGCQPFVSASEIDLQSWQTYGLMVRDFPGEPKWRLLQDETAQRIVEHIPVNVIDLAWKLAAYAAMKLPAQPLIDELLRWQRPDGRFPLAFDTTSPPADFITFQALYALALAGQRPEKMIQYVLKSQRTDGSWQGDPEYKGFNTPFRDTQFAVMALSTLFPSAASLAPEDKHFRTEHLDELLADIGDGASAAQLRRVLGESKWVLARTAAAEALGRQKDMQSAPLLAHALGDPSKLVQRAAAKALREMNARPELLSALRSNDGRTRWGALRALHEAFRGLAADANLLDATKHALSDSMPQNRFQAADNLWRWYQWTSDSSILEAVTGRMGAETDPSVRRALSESIYNMLDENEGQLAAWERTMVREDDRKRTADALHAARRRQASVLASQLQQGNRQARLGILTGLWDFHLRHMAIPPDNQQKVDVILPAFQPNYSAGVPHLHENDFIYEPYKETADFRYRATNSFQIVRLGNDSDLIHLFADSGPALANALLACLKDADPEMTLEVIKAGSVLGDAATPEFSAAMLNLLDGPNAQISSAVRYVYEQDQRGKLRLGQDAAPLCTRLLNSKKPDALAVVLPLLASSDLTRDPYLTGAVENLLKDEKLPQFGEVLRTAAHFPAIADSPLMRSQILNVLQSGDELAGQAAVDLVLERYVTDANLAALTQQFLDATHGRLRAMLIDQLDPNKYSLKVTAANSYRTGGDAPLPPDNNLFSSSLVVETIATSLTAKDRNVREAARDLVAQHDRLRKESAIASVYQPPARPEPDLAFFLERVQPILQKPGSDGKACVMCHASHAVFRLSAGNAEQNYRNALKVINVNEPRKSLLLIKPVKPNDSVSDPSLYLGTHNGGERWNGNEASPQYQTILEWIRGAKASPQLASSPCSGCRADVPVGALK